jgi:centromere protein C
MAANVLHSIIFILIAPRRTGATLKDTGIRDEHGLEPVPSFSSPEKSAPKINGVNGGAHSSYTDDVTMNIGDSKI